MQNNSDIQFQQMVAQEFGVNYAALGDVFPKKILGHQQLMNEFDTMGLSQRICKDVANMIFATPVKVTVTANDGSVDERINRVLRSELYGRLKFNELFPVHFAHFIGLGDGLMTVYRDPADNKPAINYIPIYNVIPVSYNNHEVYEVVGFNVHKLEELVYVVAIKEKLDGREISLYSSNVASLTMIDVGTPVGNRIVGNIPAIQRYLNPDPVKKFAGFSSGLMNAKGIDTPFHNGIIGPYELIERIREDYRQMAEEYKNSPKKIFITPNMVKTSIDMNKQRDLSKGTGPMKISSFDPHSTLFEVLAINEDTFKEGVPTIRFNEYKAKLILDLQQLGMSLGLGAEFYNPDTPKVEQTATQVLLQHRDAYNTVNIMKHSIDSCLRIVVNALIDEGIIDGLLDETNRPLSLDQINIEFDDGVFINKAAKVQEGINLVQAQMIDQFTFLTDYCLYSEGEARNIIKLKQEDTLNEGRIKIQLEQESAMAQFQTQIQQQMQMAQMGIAPQEEEKDKDKGGKKHEDKK